MSRLTANQIYGVWAGITMTWDEKFRFDEKSYIRNIQAMIAAGVNGIYTTGSTGEFYALEYDEFCRMVDIQSSLCQQAAMPLQIGCCSDCTAKTVKLLEYINGKKAVGAAQIVIPYWMELTDRELLEFFKDIAVACPDMPLVHYNIPRAKRFLGAQDYLRVMDAGVNLVGVKYTFAGSNFGGFQECMVKTPGLSYFVAEPFLASAMLLGARGTYSSLIGTNPDFMLDFYRTAKNGDWEKAIKIQKRIAAFYDEVVAFISGRGEGLIDPVFDKGLGVASGGAAGHQRCRKPYLGWSDETIKNFREWLMQNYPEFICKAH